MHLVTDIFELTVCVTVGSHSTGPIYSISIIENFAFSQPSYLLNWFHCSGHLKKKTYIYEGRICKIFFTRLGIFFIQLSHNKIKFFWIN